MAEKDILDKCDVILDAGDPDFAEQFREAIGAKPGETIEIITPQFTRTDGLVPSIPQVNFTDLSKLTPETLEAIGCQQWDEPNAKGETLWLFPSEWYAIIPDGTPIVDINYEHELFKRGETDDDTRCGALAFGFLTCRAVGKVQVP
jgi:hypothetical protein